MRSIEIRNIRKCFGDFQALKNVNLTIDAGEFFGLLGPNGAGKTTLISILAGLARADEGQAKIQGHDVLTDFRAARQKLGVVPQELVFDPFFTVREVLRLQSGYYGCSGNDAWIDEIMENLDLADKANTNMRALSGGMKRRVLVAQALVHRPPVIVLDEPTAGVDVGLRRTLWNFIERLNREGHTIVLTTHYLEEAEQLCDRIAMLKNGEIVALDTKAALLKRFASMHLKLQLAVGELPKALHAREVGTQLDRGVHILRLNTYDEVGDILTQCQAAGCSFEDIEIGKADLEDVFLQVMETSSALSYSILNPIEVRRPTGEIS
jgi:ABC-2 type transport system ATP-binding protein